MRAPTSWDDEAAFRPEQIAFLRKRIAELEAEIRSMLGATPWQHRDPNPVEVHTMLVPGGTGKRWRRLLQMDPE